MVVDKATVSPYRCDVNQPQRLARNRPATATIDREGWGLTWNVALEQGGWLVGKDIKLDIAVAADEVAAEVPAEPVGATT